MVHACRSNRSLGMIDTLGTGDGLGDVVSEMSVKELHEALGVSNPSSTHFSSRSIVNVLDYMPKK